MKASGRWSVAIIVVLVFFVVYLLFRLYITSQSLNDVTVVLVEQVWSLREWCVVNFHNSKARAMSWNHDALATMGRKGELLIRRFALQQQWAQTYRGFNDEPHQRLRRMIDKIDQELRAHHVSLERVTALTHRMIEEIYHGSHESAINITKTIVRQIRRF